MVQNCQTFLSKIQQRIVKHMNSIIKIAHRYLDHVKKQGIPITSVYLFGSFAKGTSKKHSDIDICLVSKSFGKDYFDEGVKLAHLTHKIDDRLEPHPMHPKDMEDKYSTFAHEIKTHGILLTK